MTPVSSHSPLSRAFSLIEMMVAMSILSVLLLLMTQILDQVQRSWTFSEARIGQFREARVAFDIITKNLGQASMNTYYDFDYDSSGNPDNFKKTSQLHFITLPAKDIASSTSFDPVGHAVFFQAPLGFTTKYRNLNSLYNGRGYFVAFGSDEKFKPSFVESEDRYRFRVFEFRPPAELNGVFQDGQEEREGDKDQDFTKWYKQAVALSGEAEDIGNSFDDQLNPLAENIITMVVAPRDSIETASEDRRTDSFSKIAPNYQYDSNDATTKYSQQVPPFVRVTVVAIDETSAVRLEDGARMPEPDLVPAALFTRTDDYDRDVADLERSLQDKSIGYRVFSTLVMLRASKWNESDD